MKKFAVILNTNQLGGAERSLIEQLYLVRNDIQFTFFIPKLGLSDTDLVKFLHAKELNNIQYYPYPGFLYKLSRKNLHLLPIHFLLSPFLLIYLFIWNAQFGKFSDFYVNGNKASFPILAWAKVFHKKISLIWHFRDFPSPRAFKIIGTLVNPIIQKKNGMRIKLIANSHAVENDLRKFFPKADIQCLYNLPGSLPVKQNHGKIKHIGIASMFAPWKGLHSVILMIGLFEKELRALGIEKFIFYGDEIYQTSGDHSSYSSQIKGLCEKFQISLVEWGGKRPPGEIFADIDVLIHPSLKPEPFGRVIIEAFKAKVPVISTCLGGSGELIQDQKQGLKWDLYDYHGLFNLLKSLNDNPQLVEDLTSRANQKAKELESALIDRVKQLFIN